MNEDRLARLEQRVDRVVGDVGELKGEVRAGFETMTERFDVIDAAHRRADVRAARVDWKTIIAFASTVVVPIVTAIIATGGGP